MTNGEKIRKEISEMSDEELAGCLFRFTNCCEKFCIYYYRNHQCWEVDCHDAIRKWLKRRARKKRILE